MASPEITLMMFYRAKYEEKKDDQHARFAKKLSKIGEPLGFDIGECPKFGKDTLAFYPDKCKSVKGLRYYGMYRYKSEINKEEYRRKMPEETKIFETSLKCIKNAKSGCFGFTDRNHDCQR